MTDFQPTTDDQEQAVTGHQERHPFRAGSFTIGLLALLAAALFLVDDIGISDIDAGVAAAVLLLVAGGALLLRTVARLTTRR